MNVETFKHWMTCAMFWAVIGLVGYQFVHESKTCDPTPVTKKLLEKLWQPKA